MSLTFIYPTALWLLLLVPAMIGLALLGDRRPTRTRFWIGLALRSLLMTALIGALAGVQLRLPSNTLTTVFVLDVSDSVPAAERARGEALIRSAVDQMTEDDQAAIVVFGGDALVERLASPDPLFADLSSVPVSSRTNIGDALQLATALFPDAGARRIVLLSDGRENVGRAVEQAELAAIQGIELSYIPLSGPEGDVEVLVERLDVPADVRQGQNFDLSLSVNSTAATDASLRIFADGSLIHSQSVRLQPGINRFRVPFEDAQGGFVRFRAQVVPDNDTWLQNNEAGAFTVVHGEPRLLLVSAAEDGANLAQALSAASMNVSTVAPADLPTTLSELAAYDGVILVNVSATALPAGSMEMLQVYVRDLGKGLLMTGGENAFGAGGYLRTPLEETLPVDMDVRSREQTPNLALALVVDKSGSMGACHCEDPNLEQTYERRPSGQPKVDIAKEAVMQAASALGPQDYLGVVAFDSRAHWAIDVNRVDGFAQIENAIGGIEAEGDTNIKVGVESAYRALQQVDARLKHIILLTDGWLQEGELATLAVQMRGEGITLSVVAAGGGSALYLMGLAEQGGGRYYPATDIMRVPDFFLKETVQAVGRYIVEEPFYPFLSQSSPVLRGVVLAELPLLWGYNGTTPKETAQVVLTTPQGDPLLATWNYGLGRAAVWTSDLKGRWATEWVTWDGFAPFVAQLVDWTLPLPQVEGIAARADYAVGNAVLSVAAEDDLGLPRNFLDVEATVIGPDLSVTETTLRQTGAGQYAVDVDAALPGAYLVRLSVTEDGEVLGQQTLGLVAPYSPEYRAGGTDRALLGRLAAVTGGGELTDPAAAFADNLPFAGAVQEIWDWLLLFVVLLFPLDIALRRVMLEPGLVGRLAARLGLSRAQRPTVDASDPVLGTLFDARERARSRQSRRAVVPPSSTPVVKEEKPAVSVPEEKPDEPSSTDSLARLREAKRRARGEKGSGDV